MGKQDVTEAPVTSEILIRLKTFRSSFESLRTNGRVVEIICDSFRSC